MTRPPRWASYGSFTAVLAMVATLCVIPVLAQAHPSHSSYAEIEWSTEGTLDVALRVTPEDLERALSLAAGRNVVLVDEPEVRELLRRYLNEHFQLIPEPAAAGTTLVGMELDYRETWIYFSLAGTGPADTELQNTLMMDLEPGQTNRVRRLWAPEAPVLVFSAAEPRRPLAVPES